MMGLDLEHVEQWSLSPFFGYDHPLFLINIQTIIHTWIIIGLLAIVLLFFRWIILKTSGQAQYCIISYVSFFIDLTKQALGKSYLFGHLAFIVALFSFILVGNIISIIPWLDEPTKDLNTTLALGLLSFIYVQISAIVQRGLVEYIKDYFSPFFLMFPLNLVGKLSSIISISFRLFGNIFGGSIIGTIYFSAIQGSVMFELLGIFSGMNLAITLFFTLFEGFLQAFVFAMLSLTYLGIALQNEN